MKYGKADWKKHVSLMKNDLFHAFEKSNVNEIDTIIINRN